jgi:hypothetical protein
VAGYTCALPRRALHHRQAQIAEPPRLLTVCGRLRGGLEAQSAGLPEIGLATRRRGAMTHLRSRRLSHSRTSREHREPTANY